MSSRNDFLKQVETIDRTGKIHKAKLAGMIYDLVDNKIRELKTEALKLGIGTTNQSENIEHLGETLKSLTKNFVAIQEAVSGLDNRIHRLEAKFSNMEEGENSKKIKLKTSKE